MYTKSHNIKNNPIKISQLNYEKFAIPNPCNSVTYDYLCALISNQPNE